MVSMKIENYEGLSITNRSRTTNVATLTFASAHGFVSGDTVRITDVGGSDYNTDSATITVTSTTTFTYPNVGSNEGTTGDTTGLVYEHFIWSNNPQVYDRALKSNNTVKEIPYGSTHILISNGALKPVPIYFSGHFFGTSKRVYLNSLGSHIFDKQLKKLYFGSDRFGLCFGDDLKETNTGQKTNFIDYVGNLIMPITILQGNTQRSDIYNGAAWTTGTVVNAGEYWTFIEKIVMVLDGSGSAGDTITIRDNSSHGIKITLNAYSENDVLTLYLVKVNNIGTSELVTTEYWYCDQDGTKAKRVTNSADKGMNLILQQGENVNTLGFTFAGTGGVKTYAVYFRDGYLY